MSTTSFSMSVKRSLFLSPSWASRTITPVPHGTNSFSLRQGFLFVCSLNLNVFGILVLYGGSNAQVFAQYFNFSKEIFLMPRIDFRYCTWCDCAAPCDVTKKINRIKWSGYPLAYFAVLYNFVCFFGLHVVLNRLGFPLSPRWRRQNPSCYFQRRCPDDLCGSCCQFLGKRVRNIIIIIISIIIFTCFSGVLNAFRFTSLWLLILLCIRRCGVMNAAGFFIECRGGKFTPQN